jgi:DNA-binding NarL/FixJ family response regulator
LTIYEADHMSALDNSAAEAASVILMMHQTETPIRQTVSAIEQMRARLPRTPVGIISDKDDRETIMAVLHAGAQGLIPMRSCVASLLPILQLLAAGERFVPCADVGAAESPTDGYLVAGDSFMRHQSSQPLQLTSREQQVFKELLLGKSNKSIARSLAMQENTVKIHLRNIYKKLGVRSRCAAIVLAKNTVEDSPRRPSPPSEVIVEKDISALSPHHEKSFVYS